MRLLLFQQEPGNNGTEIMNGITHVRPGFGFVPKFQIFEKVEVNGANEHQLFTYLKVPEHFFSIWALK